MLKLVYPREIFSLYIMMETKMDLKVAPTLVGQAYPGQTIVLVVESVEYAFENKPHPTFNEMEWCMIGQDAGTIRFYFPRLGEDWTTQFDPSFFKVYLSAEHPVSLGLPVYLRAVPRGMALTGDRANVCLGRLQDIKVN